MVVETDVSVAEDIEAGDDELPSTSSLQCWVQSAYQGTAPAVVSIRIAGAEEIRQLNRDYRGRDKPTNVLSFPLEAPAEIEPRQLGDIALCVPVISTEARAQNKPLIAHWAHMLVHGMLHLQGYDHIDEQEAEEMERLEIHILEKLGYANPYLEPTRQEEL